MDNLLKYLEFPRIFQRKAVQISIDCKRQERELITMAKSLNTLSPKNDTEFLQLENMREFLLTTADLNQRTLKMIDYIEVLLKEIAADAALVLDGAKLRNQMQDHTDTINQLITQRDNFIKEYGRRGSN